MQQLNDRVDQVSDRQNATDKHLANAIKFLQRWDDKLDPKTTIEFLRGWHDKLDRFFAVFVVVAAMGMMHLYAIDTRLDAMSNSSEARFDAMETRLDAMSNSSEARFGSIDAEIKAIHAMLAQQLQLLTGLVQNRV